MKLVSNFDNQGQFMILAKSSLGPKKCGLGPITLTCFKYTYFQKGGSKYT